MADYWMKLYIEILDDPKMATLPDRVWRRVIELFLVAKRLGKEGHLPDTRQVAWMLRMSPDELEADMAQIVHTGIIEREVNGWFIPKFAQRQAAVPPAERKAQQRGKEKSQQYYGYVTSQSRSVTQSTEDRLTENRLTEDREQNTEADTEQTQPAALNIYSVYEREIGALTPMIAEDLKDAEATYPPAWIIDSIQEAVRKNARNWKYCLAILKRWQVEGRTEKPQLASKDVKYEPFYDEKGVLLFREVI